MYCSAAGNQLHTRLVQYLWGEKLIEWRTADHETKVTVPGVNYKDAHHWAVEQKNCSLA